MSSDRPTVRTQEGSGRSDGADDEPRILLFMQPGRNRELLVETLGEHYRVETTTDVQALETDFDCCVFDRTQFNRVGGTLQSRRNTSNPVFLPFVLLVGGDTGDAPIPEVWEYVDDIIELPVKKRVLRSRIRNLVERRRTALRLAEREAQLRRTVVDLELKERAMDAAPVGISITDPDREDNPLIYVNEQFEELTGYTDVVGENCRFLQGEETDPETTATIRKAIDASRPVSVDIVNYRKNGRKFWNKLDIAPISSEGAVTNFVGFQTDITERKIGERRLEVLNRVLDHNLRNKMTVIEGRATLLREEFDADPPESLTAIEEAATDLMGLADTIRDLDRVLSESDRTGPIALTERMQQLVGALEDRFPAARIELTTPDADPCCVEAPGLVTAIQEAMENAVEHNDTGEPVVELRVERRSNDWIDIGIRDNGPGIPEQELDVLRDGETSLNHASRLGLWFIYWVVSRAGGTLSVTEVKPRGSELTLSVPTGRSSGD